MSSTVTASPLSTLTPPAPANLRDFNTLGLAATAAYCVTVADVGQLPALSELARNHTQRFVLGGGSNVVLPADVPGLVIRVALPGLQVIEDRADACVVEAGAGQNWHELVQTCVDRGLGGLENLALIPGQVGAAPVQNIGAYGLELADRFLELDAWDIDAGHLVTFDAQACQFAYRDSIFKHAKPGRWLITSVRLLLPKPWQAVLRYPDLLNHPILAARDTATLTPRDIFDAVVQVRQAKLPDPVVLGNAGSFFKNPIVDAQTHARLKGEFPALVSYPQPDEHYKLAAGWLIDTCGWKGRSLGAAGVHDRQALVLVNRGGATADDILTLAQAIQNDVRARFGVSLEPEPIVVS